MQRSMRVLCTTWMTWQSCGWGSNNGSLAPDATAQLQPNSGNVGGNAKACMLCQWVKHKSWVHARLLYGLDLGHVAHQRARRVCIYVVHLPEQAPPPVSTAHDHACSKTCLSDSAACFRNLEQTTRSIDVGLDTAEHNAALLRLDMHVHGCMPHIDSSRQPDLFLTCNTTSGHLYNILPQPGISHLFALNAGVLDGQLDAGGHAEAVCARVGHVVGVARDRAPQVLRQYRRAPLLRKSRTGRANASGEGLTLCS